MTEDSATKSLQNLLDDGWTYHDKESERLARELETAAVGGVSSDLLVPFLHLSTHTIGEHLGDWGRALRLGRLVLNGRTPTFDTAKGWARLQVAAILAGDPIEAAELELSYLRAAGSTLEAALLDMRFMLIGCLANSKRLTEAVRLFDSAVALLEQIDSTDSLDRTVAAVSNNLGWELYEKVSRPPGMDMLMRLCADTSLKFWLKCGNWINEERALYFRALVSNAVGDPRSALADADKALAVIDTQGQRPLDAALLHLARAAALAMLGDENGESQAIIDADVAASKLTATDLQEQFAAERAKFAPAA
jgi:tetratricopeptide (TPR) repeat protein